MGEIAELLSTFTKLQKAIICIVTSVRSAARMEQLVSHWAEFHGI
jgi:hypothetical protein